MSQAQCPHPGQVLLRGLRHFSLSAIHALPSREIGVYGIWYQNYCCIYIGSTIDQGVRTRLFQHWLGSHNPGLAQWILAFPQQLKFSYINIKPEKVEAVEVRLIRELRPLTNRRL